MSPPDVSTRQLISERLLQTVKLHLEAALEKLPQLFIWTSVVFSSFLLLLCRNVHPITRVCQIGSRLLCLGPKEPMRFLTARQGGMSIQMSWVESTVGLVRIYSSGCKARYPGPSPMKSAFHGNSAKKASIINIYRVMWPPFQAICKFRARAHPNKENCHLNESLESGGRLWTMGFICISFSDGEGGGGGFLSFCGGVRVTSEKRLCGLWGYVVGVVMGFFGRLPSVVYELAATPH